MTNIPTIRNELPADVAAIEALTIAAFLNAPHRDGREQTIINALRTDGELSLSLVAVDENQIVGHVAVSPVSITDGALDWYGLGPISVTTFQHFSREFSRLRRLESQRHGDDVIQPGPNLLLGADASESLQIGHLPREPCTANRSNPPRFFWHAQLLAETYSSQIRQL